MEKILKTIDALKMPSLSSSDANIPGTISSAVVAASDAVKTKKKERINHCRAVADAVCNPSVQSLTDYNKILESVTEVLFQLCNDPDSDIRLVASDCLNRIAKTLKDSLQPKFHMEVYREIRKNQSPRSLRTALSLFAFFSPMIRPQKCRAFLASLLPCFAQISKRTEELLYENISTSLTEIFKYLGPFTHESEIKILCKDFQSNLESNSAIIRRASASILVAVCKYSKNPWDTLPKLLSKVTELLMPSLMEKSVSVIIGVLLCVRQCIPCIYDEIRSGHLRKPSPEQSSVVANLLQVYEMCMILCNHDDHNVITTSLETLQQLFTSPVEPVLLILTSSSGIQNSLDDKTWTIRQYPTPLASSSENLVFSDETSNLLESDIDVPKFRSVISSEASDTKEDFDSELEQTISSSPGRRNSDLFIIEGTLSDAGSTSDGFQPSDEEQNETIRSEHSILQTFPELQIGSLYEKNIPIYYCARFLAYNFLLSGQKGIIRPDAEVRISAKVLATNCIVNLVTVCPEVFKLTLAHDLVEAGNENDQQTVQDLTIYASHADPLLRGTVYVLVGAFIQSSVIKNVLNPEEGEKNLNMLADFFRTGLQDSSNVGVKCAISGVNSCIHMLLKSPVHFSMGKSLLADVLQTAINPYWLVKVDLSELVSSIDWALLDHVDDIKSKTLSTLLEFLADEDSRVRTISTSAIIKFVRKCGTRDNSCWEPYQVFCKECVANNVNVQRSIIVARTKHPCSRCLNPCPAATRATLEHVLNKMLENLRKIDNKYLFAGNYSALAQISEQFEPRLYRTMWGCFHGVSNVNLTLSMCVDTLRTSAVIYDLVVHQSVLCLAGNLFVASDFYKASNTKEKTVDENNPFRCHNVQVSNYGIQLLQHCLAVIKMYQNVIESISSTSSLRRQSTSPVISPVKKFSQKLEAEKKAQESESEKRSKGLSFSDTVCQNHFKKMHDAVVFSWKIFKSTLDAVVTAKFTSLLITAFHTIRKLFSCIRPDYPAMTALIDELLKVSTVLFYLCPIPIMQNIREMLKCIFSLYDPDSYKAEFNERIDTKTDLGDFLMFTKTYENILVENRLKEPKPASKTVPDKSSLGSYIRQFESAVVTALKIYTTSSDPEIQSEVLGLLVQLIKGHVNYGLVDSSQVFLGFVTKQVSFLEEGHSRNPDLVTQEIFQYLTILTHEYNSSKKFIDLEKIISLCDGLVSVAEKSVVLVPAAVSALKFIVNDLFILRGSASHTNQEKKEYESQRETILQMTLRLVHPEVLPIMWLLLKGRKINNEAKWMETSEVLKNAIMPRLLDGTLSITTMAEFKNLAAFLYSLNVSAVSSQDSILLSLTEQLKFNNQNKHELTRWCVIVNSLWLLLCKRIRDSDDTQTLNGATSSLLLRLLEKFLDDLSTMFQHFQNIYMITDQIGAFLKISEHLLRSDNCENLRQDLRSHECINSFIQISQYSVKLSVLDSRLRLWMVELLTSIHYPKIIVWETLLKPSETLCGGSLDQCIIKIINEINEGDIPTLEEWVITNHSRIILKHISHTDVILFIRRLSTYRTQQILDQITLLLDSPCNTLLARSMLSYLEKVADSFLCETAVLAVKILKQTDLAFLSLEVSQFCCYVFSHILARKMLFGNKDREFMREYFADPFLLNRYPRLVTLAHKILSDSVPSSLIYYGRDGSSPVFQWCSEDINENEGVALAKMLSSMKYTQIISILNSTTFNMSLLKHCFRHLQRAYQSEIISTSDVSDLLTSQKRSGLIEIWPFPVAAVEFIMETLDSWEIYAASAEKENYAQSLLDNWSLKTNICHMWSALTEMLILKKMALKVGETEARDCCNNFIPTSIFTMSFQYMTAKYQAENGHIPFDDMRVFLKFASVAVCDTNFLSFFDMRDNPQHIFTCVMSIGSISRKLVSDLNINFRFSQAEIDIFGGMNEDCVKVLSEFYHLMKFLQQPQGGKYYLEQELLQDLRNVVAGLGRCELVNGWILISHLGWKPQELNKTQIFPSIQQIPLEILRNETDMLLQYISKLNLLGVASKIQFEENWVIFLSVINLYVDETFQLQIVTTGLRALSMMLQQSIKIKYAVPSVSESPQKVSAKIDWALEEIEPELCRSIHTPRLAVKSTREFENQHNIDVNSCIRFLTDLYTQWLQNPQGKMPLLLLSEVIQSIVIMSQYFDDPAQYTWMYETLVDIPKSFDKEDEILWPHLIYGIFYSAANLSLGPEAVTNLTQILESSLTSTLCANVANVQMDCALVYLQSHPDCLAIINTILPYVLKNTQLDEMTNDWETHCLKVWKLLLFIWIYGPAEGLVVQEFEQETLRNVLTVLSPLNKVYVSVRLLVLKGLRLKVEMRSLKPDVKKTIAKVTLETLRTPNVCIFFQTLKLYLSMFYDDFGDYIDKSDLDPEVLMPMAERSDILFQHLRSKTKCHNEIVSKVLPLVIGDFLPPSEILNRVIAEFLSPAQTCPELVAPALAQVFEKARRRFNEAALVREWILASLPNFLANSNVARTIWSLTLFFIGVSSSPEVACLLPYAQLRRRSTQVKGLFVYSASDFYLTLDEKKRHGFKKLMSEGPVNCDEKKPYGFLVSVLDKLDSERDQWAIDRVGDI